MRTSAPVCVGPGDNGRRMPLRDFVTAEGQEGWRYELSRGVVSVLDIRGFRHFAVVEAFRRQLYTYEFGQPPHPLMIGCPGHAKLVISAFESERHPDITVYLTPPPIKRDDPWEIWIPEMVIEVTDPETRHVDLELKPEEYMAFGVKEYVVVDSADKQIVLFSVDAPSSPRVLESGERYASQALASFVLNVSDIFKTE